VLKPSILASGEIDLCHPLKASEMARLGRMADKTYLVRLKPPSLAIQQVVAARAEIQDDHLAFVRSDGKLAALFLMELVEGWNDISG
jgi:hypothetical protein